MGVVVTWAGSEGARMMKPVSPLELIRLIRSLEHRLAAALPPPSASPAQPA